MKHLLLTLILSAAAFAVQAQDYYDDIERETVASDNNVSDNKVYDAVEQNPQFPGGEVSLQRYIASHIRYPGVCQQNGTQGRVTVKFVVKKNGSVGQVKVVRGVDPDLDKEAVRVVKSLPKFTPGKINGRPVNVWYTTPVIFRLEM